MKVSTALLGACAASLVACGITVSINPVDDAGADSGTPSVDGGSDVAVTVDSSADGSSDASDGGGDAKKDCSKSNTPVFLAPAENAGRLDANATHVYWVAGSLYRVSKQGGEPEVVAPKGLHLVKANATHVCFGTRDDAGTKTLCALSDGGAPKTIESSYAHDLTLTNDTIYFVRGALPYDVRSAKLDGTDNTLISGGTVDPTSGAGGVVRAGAHVVYSEGGEEVKAVSNGNTIVVGAAAGGPAYHFISDGTDAYWQHLGSVSGVLAGTHGGIGANKAVVIAGFGNRHSWGQAVDDKYIYAALRNPQTSSPVTAQIARVAKTATNGSMQPIVENLFDAVGLAVDDKCIYYWADEGGANGKKGIFAVKKPAP